MLAFAVPVRVGVHVFPLPSAPQAAASAGCLCLAHGTGTVAAVIVLGLLWFRDKAAVTAVRNKAPLWAYLGGISGAATVMLTSTAVNTPLALAGTLALGLAGQVAFSLAADKWGLFGLPSRRLTVRDAGAVVLITAGSLIIIFFGMGGAA